MGPIFANYDIAWFDVPVDNTSLMQSMSCSALESSAYDVPHIGSLGGWISETSGPFGLQGQ